MVFLVLIFGVFSCSTSVIFIRWSETDPVMLTAYRLILGGLFLLPFYLRAREQHRFRMDAAFARKIVPPALFLALHFVSWIIGARMTPAANATLIVNMVPVAMPFTLYFLLRERLTRPEVAGTLFALSGVVLLGVSDFRLSAQYALGDAVCFVSMLVYALYLTAARRNRDIPSVYLYVVPVYLLASVFALGGAALALPFGAVDNVIGPDIHRELFCILALGAVPTVLGHSIINWALRHMRGQTVAIVNLHQFLFAGILAYIVFAEVPAPYFWVACLLVIIGAVIVIQQKPPGEPLPRPPHENKTAARP
ncbi:MAG: DMT family transporter [Opitutales bacterium]|nr:DMT family transporter [Opitutales bacterium]